MKNRYPDNSQDGYRLYYDTLQASPDAVLWVDASTGRIQHANRSACRRLGYAYSELTQTALWDLDTGIAENEWPAHVHMMTNTPDRIYETALVTNTGDHLPVEITCSLVESENRPCLCCFIRDVSQCRRSEVRSRQSEERLRAIVQALPDLVFVLDEDGRHLEVLTARENLLYASTDRIRGRRLHDIFPDPLADTFLSLVQNTIQNRQSGVIEYELPIDGKVRCFEARTAPMERKINGKNAVVWIARDITERQQAEQALRDSEERLQAIGRALPDLVFVVDEEGRYLDILTAEKNLLYADPGSLKGRRIHDLFPPAEADTYLGAIQRTIETGTSEKLEYELKVPAGRRWFEARTGPMNLRIDGKRCGVFIARDITDRKQAERLKSQNIYLQEELKSELNYGEIIGESSPMKAVFKDIGMVAETDATVLLLGETGTGKELIARAIHAVSRRKHKPLIKINCGVFAPGLIENELFGHEKGGYTGAESRKKGRFELAHQGTLFLDEVGELPPEAQIKLLRVLQEQEFERIGGEATLKVDVRVIAATNRDLEAAVKEGRFRSDLYYRLNIFPIRIPPLRERKEDITHLTDYLVEKISVRLGKRIQKVSPEVIHKLNRSDWPGNVRELANILERAVILCPEPVLTGQYISGLSTSPAKDSTFATLEEIERRHILAALKKTNGVLSGPNGAAALLQINRSTLWSRMQRLGIQVSKVISM